MAWPGLMGEGAAVRGLIASIGGVAVLTATLLVAPGPAAAQPTTVAGLLAYYHDLSQEAERVNEELLILQEQVSAQERASAAATKAATEAEAVADTARAKINSA